MLKLPDPSTFVDGQFPPGVDPNQKYIFIDLTEYPEHHEYHDPDWNTKKFHYLETGYVGGLYPVCFSGKEVCIWGLQGGQWRRYKEVVLIPVDDAYYEAMRAALKRAEKLNGETDE